MGGDGKSLRNLVCGGFAGVASRTVVSPLERLKILYQVQYMTGHGSSTKYRGVFDSLRLILREEGVRGFYKGNGANALRVFPYVGIQFAGFSQFQSMWFQFKGRAPGSTLSPLEKLLVGAASGVTSVLFTYPLDFVRGRLTAQGGATEVKYNGISDALVKVTRSEGVTGLYRGISPTLLGVAPYVGVNFLVYESLKEICPSGDDGRPSAGWLAVCGGVAGTTGQTVAYPADLLRRRFQLQNLEDAAVKYRGGIFSAVSQIIRQEGVLGLYKGYLPNFVKTWPTIAMMFWGNDMLRRSESVNRIFGTRIG